MKSGLLLLYSATFFQAISSFSNHHLFTTQNTLARGKSKLDLPAHKTRFDKQKLSARRRGGDDDFEEFPISSVVPTTSFGAEAVPEGQRPANEYLDLIRAPLFSWAMQEKGNNGLLIRLAAVYAVVFALIGFPIAGATYTEDGFLLQRLAAANVGTMSFVIALLVRLYSGWGYVGARLQSKVVEFEETGWFDGAFEEKSEKENARDLFLYRSDVKPVVDRLKLFIALAVGIWLASIIGLNTATSMKPKFDEYDNKMLNNLQYNDKLADVAAQQSGGRPTYCENRYYRAIANGGQGCN